MLTSSTELEQSDDKDNDEHEDDDSAGDSKYWDSGVGSSSERTSTLSVSEGIRRFSQVYNQPENIPQSKGKFCLLYLILSFNA